MFLSAKMQARLQARFFQYSLESLILAADLSDLPQKQIQSGFHFWSEFLTITFETLDTEDGSVTDTGVCMMSAQFKSGSNQIGLSNDFIDLQTIAVPGRVQAFGIAGNPSNPLHIQGFPWPYLYESTGSITIDLRKNVLGNADTKTKFVFTGFLIPTFIVPDSQTFYQYLASDDPSYGMPLNQA